MVKPSAAPRCTVFARDVTEKGCGAGGENLFVEKDSSRRWIAVGRGILRARCTPLFARVVKLVDTGDLKSPDHCDRAGSSPAPGTTRVGCPYATLGVEKALTVSGSGLSIKANRG